MNVADSVVLFDIDGTLIRKAGPHHKNALIEGIRRVTGLAATLDGIATQGTLDRDLILGMLANHESCHNALPDIFLECQQAYLSNCPDDLRNRVCPGVPELLHRLIARGTALGLVTGNLSAIAWKKIELAGLRDFFSFGAFSEDAHTRTALAGIAARQALARGLAAPSALIGDHPNDIQAAQRNGYLSVAVATGISTVQELAAANPSILIETLIDLDVELLFCKNEPKPVFRFAQTPPP